MNAFDAKEINLDDQGVYYSINKNTGGINNIFQLAYDDAQWYLYQLKNLDKNGSMGWVILSDENDYALALMPEDEVIRYFAKPEFLEPKGVWQILRNARFGFGKFTPESVETGIRFGLIVFTEDGGLIPLLIDKANDEVLTSLAVSK